MAATPFALAYLWVDFLYSRSTSETLSPLLFSIVFFHNFFSKIVPKLHTQSTKMGFEKKCYYKKALKIIEGIQLFCTSILLELNPLFYFSFVFLITFFSKRVPKLHTNNTQMGFQ